MALNVKLRFYGFPSSTATELNSLALKEENLDGKSLLQQISETVSVSPDEITLVLCGRTVNTSTKLSAACLQDGHLIQVVYKPVKEKPPPQLDIDVKQLQISMAGLHFLFHGRHHKLKAKKRIIELLTDHKKLLPIIKEIPGLEDDPVSLDILRNPTIFSHAVDPSNMERLLDSYKNVAAAVIAIWKKLAIKNEIGSFDTHPPTSRVWFGDEGMEVDQNIPGTSRGLRNRPRSSPRLITPNQLAQALSLASSPTPGRIFPSPMSTPQSNLQSPQTGSRPSSSSAANREERNIITPDVFSLAMQQALSQAATSNPTADQSTTPALPQLSPAVMERGLEQLRGMGIADEAACKQALTIAGGDIEAAVNILFSSEMQNS